MRLAFAAILLAVSVGAAHAQDPVTDPACANVRSALPKELAGWSQQMPVAAGVEAGGGAAIVPGQAVLVSLHSAKHLTLSPGTKEPAQNGGTLSLTIAAAGTYRLALGDKAWVDLVRGGKALASTAHGHGPQCSGVRKLVDFSLSPGTYTVQLSGSATERVALLVVKVA